MYIVQILLGEFDVLQCITLKIVHNIISISF